QFRGRSRRGSSSGRRRNWLWQLGSDSRVSALIRGKILMAKNGHNNGKPLNVVGKPFRKVDARAKCTGQTKFADDIVLPRMLACKILRSHEPHALIKNIDVSKALALPGVFAIITGKDLPIPYGILPVSQDEHALCIDKVRFIG